MKDQAKMNVPSLKATAASSGSSESTDFQLVHENMVSLRKVIST